MLHDLAHEEIVFLGFSANILNNLAALPEGSVVVFEEPDVIRKRDMHRLVEGFPMVSRVVPCEYQRSEPLARLVAHDPVLRAARAVVPGVEYAVGAAARAAAALGLPGAGTLGGEVFRDKYRLRELAASAGIRNPPFARVETVAEAEAFFASVNGPCVLKPTSRQASLGVQIFTERGDIAEGWGRSTDLDEGRVVPDRGIESGLVMERAVRGREYSVEVLVARGQVCFSNVTAKDVLPGRFPVEMGHVMPAPIDGDLERQLVAGTARLAAAARFGAGILHCEWIVDDAGPVLVECAARMPGDEIPKLLALAYDFPFVEAYLRTLLGDRPSTPPAPASAAAITFLTAPPGLVAGIAGVADAEEVPGVEVVKVAVAQGATIRSATSSWDRAGYVIARGATPADAEHAAAKAAAAISISTTAEE